MPEVVEGNTTHMHTWASSYVFQEYNIDISPLIIRLLKIPLYKIHDIFYDFSKI